jgi:hypothetical protein
MSNGSSKKAWAVATAFVACASHAISIEPPKVNIIDDMGVNMATGQVTYSITPVSIGGPMGLSYTVSVYANEARWGAEGFSSAFNGFARAVQLTTQIGYSPWRVMRVTDGRSSVDFKVLVDGVMQSDFLGLQPPYSYEPIGDQRDTLEVNGTYLDWTKADGTVVRFLRFGTTADYGAGMTQFIHPNGLTINIGADGITNSAGFQLKPMLEPDHRPFDKVDNPNIGFGVPPAGSSAAQGWSSFNPTYVKALNNAIEYCAPAPTPCNPTRSWPTATIEYPPGMPRTLFIGDSIIKVIDASGAVTALRYRAHDLAYDQNGNVVSPYTPGTELSPRLVGIKPVGSSQETFNYEYNNLFSFHSSVTGNYMSRVQTAGVVRRATHISEQAGYTMLTPTMGGIDYRNNASGAGGVSAVHVQPRIIMGNPDMLWFAETREGRVTFETNHARNAPASFERLYAPRERYSYDARGNLTRIEYLIDGVYVMHQEAQYPASCAAATRKTCNQAEWIADAKGNTTYFTYHAQSGQVESVTSPQDQDGKRAQTRYEYTPLSARYFNGGSSRINGPPIWMRTAEKYCIDSNYSSGCQGADEVVTRFEYNHDNLLMSGMTVTSPGGVALRTCFQYDRFGNQIGTTTPNANRTDCSN